MKRRNREKKESIKRKKTMNPLGDMDYIREDLHVEALALVHADFLESRVCSEVYITRKYLNKIYEIKVQNK